MQLYAILDSVSDRIEMHKNLGEQRQNWNNLLLNNINMITLTATTLTGVAAASGAIGAPLLALKISSTLLFSAATSMLLIMNKIQPSQLAEEQRCATRLFKQLRSQIENRIAFGNQTEQDVKNLIEKVLALDKAYPLPLL
ncbi:putative F-box protein, partial [Trifolium medium]|nr:putative F-box protein [Trifolium medium]